MKKSLELAHIPMEEKCKNLLVYRALSRTNRKVLLQYWRKVNPILKAALYSTSKFQKQALTESSLFPSNLIEIQNKSQTSRKFIATYLVPNTVRIHSICHAIKNSLTRTKKRENMTHGKEKNQSMTKIRNVTDNTISRQECFKIVIITIIHIFKNIEEWES